MPSRPESLVSQIKQQLRDDADPVLVDRLETAAFTDGMEAAARIAALEVGTVFSEPAPLKSRLVAILAPTLSLRKMARTTRQRVASDIRRSLKERQK